MSLSNNSTFNHNLKGPNERANLASSHKEEIGIPPLGKSIKSVKKSQHLSWQESSDIVWKDHGSSEIVFVRPTLAFSLLNNGGQDTTGLIIVFWLINITGTLFVDPELLYPILPLSPVFLHGFLVQRRWFDCVLNLRT